MDSSVLSNSKLKKMVYAMNYIEHPQILNPEALRRNFDKFFRSHPVLCENCITAVPHPQYEFDWYTSDQNEDYLTSKKESYFNEINVTLDRIEGDKIILSHSKKEIQHITLTGRTITVPYIYFYIFYIHELMIRHLVVDVQVIEEGDFFGGGTHFYEVSTVTPGSEKLVDIIRTNPTIFPHLIHRFPADDIINSL